MYKTKEDILSKAKEMIGFSIGEIDLESIYKNTNSKGRAGHVVEALHYGYELNNNREPDFVEAGIELKTTGYVWLKNQKQVSAKERLSLTMIDYLNDYKTDFHKSLLFPKISMILLKLYEYDTTKKFEDMIFTNVYLYEYKYIPEKDKLIIENDWKIIQDKIKSGLAHELSEGDTMYLGASTKGKNKQDTVKQKFSDIKAMQRAYSFKNRYMTYLLRNYVFNEVENRESFIKSISSLENNSLEDIVNQTLSEYVGKDLDEIDKQIKPEKNIRGSKQFLNSYIMRMLNLKGKDPHNIEEFYKADISVKTIRFEANGNLKESMSFPYFDFSEVSNETWEDAQINDFFNRTKFLFAVFQKTDNGNFIFKGSFFWNMPYPTIENEIKRAWEDTNRVLNNTIELKVSKNRVYNNFPKTKGNKVAHVRNHGSDRKDTMSLPRSTSLKIISTDNSVDLSIYTAEHKFSKLSFWLNASYIKKLVKDNLK